MPALPEQKPGLGLDARKPSAVWLRVPLGIVLTIAGFFGFLPVLGFWMTPLGVALLVIDLPFLRGPMARVLAFFNRKLAPLLS
jgi:hypothetical protein